MKKIQKSMLLFNSFTMKAESNTFDEDAFSVVKVEGGVRITAYKDEDKPIKNPVFPNFIKDEKLVEIGAGIFANNPNISGTATL